MKHQNQESLWEILFEQAIDGIVVMDRSGKVYRSNKRFADMLGYTMEEMQDLHVWDWDRQFTKEELQDWMYATSSGDVRFETRHVRKNGITIDVEISVNITTINGQTLALCICRDVTERKLIEEQIYIIATTDSLTGTLNRREGLRILTYEMDRAKRYATPLSVAIFDIDHFKRINDTFGHDVGDDVLKAVSQLAKDNIRAVDSIARWGGEEFLILLTQTDLSAARTVAEKLHQAMETYRFDALDSMTASFGVTEFTSTDDSRSLLKRADMALYKAKRGGRNRVDVITAGEKT